MVYILLLKFRFEVVVRSGIEHLFMGPSHKHGYKSRYFFRDSKKIIAFYFVLRLIFLNFAIRYTTSKMMKQRNATYNALNMRDLKKLPPTL